MQTHIALMQLLAGLHGQPPQRILNSIAHPAVRHLDNPDPYSYPGPDTRHMDNPDPYYHNTIDQIPWHNPFHPAGSQHAALLAQALVSNTNNPAVSYRNAMASRFLQNVAY